MIADRDSVVKKVVCFAIRQSDIALGSARRQPGLNEITAMRNATLQGGYLIIAARALGLDCGPMSGFDNAGVDNPAFASRGKRLHAAAQSLG